MLDHVREGVGGVIYRGGAVCPTEDRVRGRVDPTRRSVNAVAE